MRTGLINKRKLSLYSLGIAGKRGVGLAFLRFGILSLSEPAISIDPAALLGTLEMLENASPNSNTNRDSTLTLSEDY
jgi:hypothetical protein